MGYYSTFKIAIHDKDMNEIYNTKIVGDIFEELEESCGYNRLVFEGVQDVKWYSHQEDMIAISLQYPEYTFFVERMGEDRTDYWHCYYRAGKQAAYQAKIEFTEFSEKDFKDPRKDEW